MKAKYVKPELNIVDFEINAAISSCSTTDGSFEVNACEHPGDMIPANAFLDSDANCEVKISVSCKHTSMTMNFAS